MSDKPCEHIETIVEMKNDIKWLVSDSKRRNGIMESHIADSDDFRMQVTRNTAWRHALKISAIGCFASLGALWLHVINK